MRSVTLAPASMLFEAVVAVRAAVCAGSSSQSTLPVLILLLVFTSVICPSAGNTVVVVTVAEATIVAAVPFVEEARQTAGTHSVLDGIASLSEDGLDGIGWS